MLIKKLASILRPCTVYIKVHKNGFNLRHIESGTELLRQCKKSFTTRRLLVGDFVSAEKCLSDSLRELLCGCMYFIAPRVVIQPTDMTEDGLSPVEERVLLELAHGAGAFFSHHLGRATAFRCRSLVSREGFLTKRLLSTQFYIR